MCDTNIIISAREKHPEALQASNFEKQTKTHRFRWLLVPSTREANENNYQNFWRCTSNLGVDTTEGIA